MLIIRSVITADLIANYNLLMRQQVSEDGKDYAFILIHALLIKILIHNAFISRCFSRSFKIITL